MEKNASSRSGSSLERLVGAEGCAKIARLSNPHLESVIADYVSLLKPARVFVSSDSPADIAYIKRRALEGGEERRLANGAHTIHFDGVGDQGRSKEDTRILLSDPVELGPDINVMEREKGVREVLEILDGAAGGRELFVCFFCLGPSGSEFSIPCLQVTDSAYVAHSEHLLYRPGYAEFKARGEHADFFRFVHSGGELEGAVSKNVHKRRIYLDVEKETVYTANTQYAGNSVGLKKLAMRLAISRASHKGWLTEHMFVMGVRGAGGRVTYVAGAFPSMCGKTSTAMLEGNSIVGDDIAYLKHDGSAVRAVNVEKGVFGIIHGINSKDDPVIWKALHSKNEVIFSNVLVTEGNDVYWVGKDGPAPEKGVNYSGEWFRGKKDAKGNDIGPSHKNARFTFDLGILENADERLDDPKGVELAAIIYGGRDSDTSVPVEEAFDWVHGVITKGAALESETTAATIGKEGERQVNPMSNLDFLSIPVAEYIDNHLKFGAKGGNPPKIFSVNYFLQEPQQAAPAGAAGSGRRFLNDKLDKSVWLKWIDLRAHGEVAAIRTPTGLIPVYADLKGLFKENLGKDYLQADYDRQFTLRIPENLAKIGRIAKIYREQVKGAPAVLFGELEAQKKRLEEARAKHGDYVLPREFPVCDDGRKIVACI